MSSSSSPNRSPGSTQPFSSRPVERTWPIRRCTRQRPASGDDEFYPDLYDKAAVLACRIAWNHPLPAGNKRAAWACLVMFVDLNGGRWSPDPPAVESAVAAMLAVAAREFDEAQFARWLGDRAVFDG